MRRRDFAKIVTHGVAGLAVGSLPAQIACAAGREGLASGPIRPIGLQLYTVRDMMAQSVRDTLVNVARVGYTEVEFAGYFGQSASALRELLDGLGMRAPATHLSLGELRDNLDRVVEFAQTLGHDYLIVPWLDPADRTVEGYRRIADEFNAIGERVREAGLSLGYHNHSFEFESIDGQIGYDILLDHARPDLVTMEIDLFWMTAAGRDPLEYFAKYPGRFDLCHVKDRDASGNMVDVGKGTLDFVSLLAAGQRAGLRHFFVEHDQPANPLGSITASFEYLARLNLR